MIDIISNINIIELEKGLKETSMFQNFREAVEKKVRMEIENENSEICVHEKEWLENRFKCKLKECSEEYVEASVLLHQEHESDLQLKMSFLLSVPTGEDVYWFTCYSDAYGNVARCCYSKTLLAEGDIE